MKKILLAAVVVGSFLLVGTGAAVANLITEPGSATDTVYGPVSISNGLPTSTPGSYHYTHDLTSGHPDNYIPGTDTLTAAKLVITLSDDDTSNDNFYITFDSTNSQPIGTKLGDPTVITFGDSTLSGDINYSLWDIIAEIEYTPDGFLGVTVGTGTGATFIFKQSDLYATWEYVYDDGLCNDEECNPTNPVLDFVPAPVPEPTSMLLLGTGLVGLAGAARRRKQKLM